MGKRRMFSTTIVADDIFLDMPLSSQALYFHLGMHADDDGFVTPRRIMRMINASNDDLQILVAKRYILVFDSGVAVVKGWPVNNYIQSDRYHATSYKDEFSTLTKNDWGSYTEKQKFTTEIVKLTDDVNNLETERIQDVSKMDTQVRLGKVKLSNTLSIDKVISADKPPTKIIATETISGLLQFWELTVGMTIDSPSNRKACAALLRQPKMDEDKLKQLIAGVALSHQDQYAPRIADFVSLKRKQNDLILWGKKRQTVNGKGFRA